MTQTPDTSRIGPTAHYTACVWYRNGLSHPALVTRLGRWMVAGLGPIDRLYGRRSGRPNLEGMLLARHRVIDHLLEQAIAAGEVTQVLEIAAGLSARGWRTTRRHPGLRYVEGDLPGMAVRKRRRLERAGIAPGHRVVELDALVDDGSACLGSVARTELTAGAGSAILCEGLLNYFERGVMEAILARIADALRALGGGLFLADLNLACDARGQAEVEAFRRGLQLVARGGVYLHYDTPAECEAALRCAGFADVRIHRPGDFAQQVEIPAPVNAHLVRLLECRVRRTESAEGGAG